MEKRCCIGEGRQMTMEDFGVEMPKPTHDPVNHPNHYTSGGIECIDAMESAFGIEWVQHFCACNAFKYIFRFLHKNGLEDIEKAVWYLNKYTELEMKKVKEEISKL